MPKRICLTPHLTIEELEQRYRQAPTLIERAHYQILWLLAQGRRSEEVAAVTGYSRNWIYELVRSYNRLGPEVLGDLRRCVSWCNAKTGRGAASQPATGDARSCSRWRTVEWTSCG